MRNVGLALRVIVSALTIWLFVSLELTLLGGIIGGLVFLAGFILTFSLENRYGTSMIRILRVDYKVIERDFRMMFKDKHIQFYKRTDEDAYSYEFPGHNLVMTVEPYVLHHLVVARQMTSQSATAVILRELSSKNKAFAEMLAQSIDELAQQRADS